MKKKYIFIIILVFVLAVIGLFVFITGNNDEKTESNPFYFFEVSKYGEISFVEDKEAGLSFIIPKGWDKKDDLMAQFSIVTEDFSPIDDKISSSSFPKNGCWIGISADHEIETENNIALYNDIIYHIEHQENIINEDNSYEEIVSINEVKSLKRSIIAEDKGKKISIFVPLNNRIYLFETYLFGEDKESCEGEFNNFLSTISIKK
ncbi:MAG: hypothetical protein PHU17_02480 [Candidatus Pacebacteria bacterium]|nr:hypothetical protein [Candidatus Paceibacterota bacterium]